MKLMVLDGNSIINRAFYGVRPLSTRDGTPTNALFGFLNILQKLLADHSPDALCVTFDVHAPTFRHQKYADYKGQRKPMPDELRTQLPLLKQILDAMRIPRYELAGWEADDLIGTISRRCEACGWDCAVVTGDKDSLQLVTQRTHVLLVTTRMGQTTTREVTPEVFRAEYGFEPIRMIDLKALMGDASDNYPGVSGIGEKTAMTLLQENGSLEEIYQKIHDGALHAKPAALRHLTEGEADARFSFDLATIRTDVPFAFEPEQNRRVPPDGPELYNLFLRLEFTKLIEKFGLTPEETPAPAQAPQVEITSETVTDPARIPALTAQWQKADAVYLLARGDLAAVAVQWGTQSAFLCEADLGSAYNDALRGLFSPDVTKISHDVKPLMHTLVEEGLSTDGFVFDTAIGAYLLSPTDGSYDLDRLFVSFFSAELQPQADYNAPDIFSGTLFQNENRAQAEAALLARTAAVAALHETMLPKLEELGLLSLLQQIELPLCPVLARMEVTGFLVDREALRRFGTMLSGRIDAAQRRIFELAGHEFNINSTQQLGTVLFDELCLPPVKKTKKGYSTSADVLEKLQGRHPIIACILEYRQLTKLSSTYVEGLDKVIAPDGRIHTSFQNTVTATGRLSSVEPNLQNIPVRTALGAEMRKMFHAGPGNVLVDADYSQIELRLLAHIANDANMIAAFNSGYDIHTATASRVFGVPMESVTPEMRRSAKAVNFGIVYGISQYSLSQDIGVTVAEAKEYMNTYFSKYSGVRAYMDSVVERARQDGYVSTLFGRRRWLPELKSSNFNLRAFGERVALNMPIQGTAADIIKLAMVRVDARLREENLQARLVLQVHDELIVECPETEADTVKQLLEDEMEHVVSYSVSLHAAAGVGLTWAEAH